MRNASGANALSIASEVAGLQLFYLAAPKRLWHIKCLFFKGGYMEKLKNVMKDWRDVSGVMKSKENVNIT